MCPTWGAPALTTSEWSHRLAHELAQMGIATVVPHWPGTGDSEGIAEALTLDRLVEAGIDTIAASEARCAVPSWGVMGIGAGAPAAVLVAASIGATRLVLVQPALDLVRFFERAERAARRAQLGREPTPNWSFGYPLPTGLRREHDASRVDDALRAFSGRGVVVRYRRPAPEPAPSGFRVITVWGDWLNPPRVDHGPLRIATVRWLRKSLRGST